MKTIETKLSRDDSECGWPKGQWDGEPDHKQWVDEITGLPCLIVRNMRRGNLCGYVGVSKGHAAFGVAYGDVYRLENEDDPVDVHGGLTYSSHCAGRICHVVEPGEDDHVWWLGFDCAHLGDSAPIELTPPYAAFRDWTASYKSFRYVEGECRNLARQLAAIGREVSDADATETPK